MKFNPSVPSIPKEEAVAVIENSQYLGRTIMDEESKDCWWSCYENRGDYYIGLCDSPMIWEADKEDIDRYCEILAK